MADTGVVSGIETGCVRQTTHGAAAEITLYLVR
jgi:hypothetical protein